ncbi:MAG: GH3 auxin-responsive promoter [Gammaproteobacteria bacterium HGW-Gammaproteobacteria-14]|nr:MAG: GH3 auxin-responsive promoter [Gammaproteobacteria bacterium HGW-Gammaproteobacteria-14]
MSLRFSLGHGVLSRIVASSEKAFLRDSMRLEEVQRHKLSNLLHKVASTPLAQRRGMDAAASWEKFASSMPVTGYEDWRERIDAQRQGGASLIASPLVRHQPTSGSTSAIKWLPYTATFLSELDQAICPWLSDIYQRYPDIRSGSHYWSLSWVPTELRKELKGQINDDMQLLSFGKRALASMTQAVPESVATAASSDDSRFATLAWLAADGDLSVLSVWSPTFALVMFDHLALWREELAQCLQKGHWGDRAAAMPSVACPKAPLRAAMLKSWDGRINVAFLHAFWPRLALVSAWDTAAAAPWARKLRELLPSVAFQGKGLWATEGVVTFPWRESYPLAFRSHVYEFLDAATGKVLAPWQLEQDQEVTPLLSTGSGLLRYRMTDRIRVNGFVNQVPSFTFLGRDDGVDLVGEKLSAVMVQQIMDGLELDRDARPVTLLALDGSDGQSSPGYVLLVEASGFMTEEQSERIADRLEGALMALFHYRLARDLGQLAAVRVVSRPDMQRCYLGYCRDRGMIDGNVKIEPLRYWPGMRLDEMLPEVAFEGVA